MASIQEALLQALLNKKNYLPNVKNLPMFTNPLTLPMAATTNVLQDATNINLDPIRVIKNAFSGTAEASQPQQQAHSLPPDLSPMPQSLPKTTQSIPQADRGNGGSFWEFIKQLGIPLAAAGIGTAFPQTLAGAAGFNQGYAGALEKEKEFDRKKDLYNKYQETYTFNPDTGQYESTGVRIPKGSQIRNLTSQQKVDAEKALYEVFGLSDGSDVPQESVASKSLKETKKNNDKVLVINPDGQEGYIPSGQLSEALKAGYKQK